MRSQMNIAICDDEKIFIDKISECVERVAKERDAECTIYTCERGKKLIRLCEEKRIDAAFLDIAMPEIDGFETAERLLNIRSNLILVFVSSQEAMVYSSYEYKPFWFVPKSQPEMLELVINKLVKKLENEEKEGDIILINVENKRIVEINLKEIVCFKTEDHYIRMVYKDGERSLSYRYKLDYVEKQLSDKWFIRVHNRYLVNCRAISYIEKGFCVLVSGEKIPVSRANMTSVKEAFQKYLRSRR